MHQALYQLGGHLHPVNLVVIGRVNGWRRHQRGGARGLVLRSCGITSLRLTVCAFLLTLVLVGAIRIGTTHEAVLIAIQVMHLGKGDIFEALSPPLLVFAEELAQLSAAVGSKAVEVAAVREGQGMGFTTGNSNYLFVLQGHHLSREGLVRLLVGIFKEVLGVVEAELAVGGLAPGIDYTLFSQGHRMGVSACQLNDELVLEAVDFLWYRHERARVNVEGHR
mmetsp:Transcript_41383/g.63076  ORF Transcript_41383/g.63076 Transcript_41383/m.63076 type:complete len:222 (-) Transcript_41383:553-1218(-)